MTKNDYYSIRKANIDLLRYNYADEGLFKNKLSSIVYESSNVILNHTLRMLGEWLCAVMRQAYAVSNIINAFVC